MPDTTFAALPTVADLKSFAGRFAALGETGDFGAALDGAVTAWQEATGYTPFLSEPEVSTLRFDAPGPAQPHGGAGFYGNAGFSLESALSGGGAVTGGGRRLNLEGGIVGLPQTVMLGGVELQAWRHYVPFPDNADAQGKPFTFLEFLRPIWSPPRGVLVTALWGYCAPPPLGRGLPGGAWSAILNKAAERLFLSLENTPDLQSISRDGLSESYEIASTPTAGQRLDALRKVFDDNAKQFRRAV